MKDLKVIFMGTPEFSHNVLDMLIKNTNVIMVVCQPDKLVGRNKVIEYPPTKKLALENNIDVYQPNKIREEYEVILESNPDIIITCAYGQIIPKQILDCPKYGCINVHASLLPKLRGGAPINHAIIDGYDKTGITIMYMAPGMDDGDIITQQEIEINDMTFIELSNKLSMIGTNLLLDTLPSIINGTAKKIKQNEDEVTFAKIIKREDEHIDFTKDGITINNLVRGLNNYPYANTIINDIEYKVIEGYFEEKESIPNKIMEITKDAIGIGCSNGIYYITKIKPSGKKEMSTKDFLNGCNKDKLLNGVVK